MRTPPWYYKEVDVENLDAIIQEFRANLPIIWPGFDINTIDKTIFKSTIANNDVKAAMPILSQYMKDIGLYDRWCITSPYVKIIGTGPTPHIDRAATPTRPARMLSFNFPIYNCQFAKTYFAKAPDDWDFKRTPLYEDKKTEAAIFPGLDFAAMEILDEVTLTKATWMRVDVPHGVLTPYSYQHGMIGNGARVSACLRFEPEPLEHVGLTPEDLIWKH